ncbi:MULTISPECIES: efflux RND transporter periplasmic adaptor subunit [unclassified Beijerinckia]|uniref:efflux RND transporter periplasmic adaptor subunit n=1 Tax=unclassified Beijerinckia TaxID=2638183 RepID=UPI00089B4724|nr:MULTISPECIES: efflux RND transporter periplasmic adaptor subunit [unclassified Beijerinckia]MDH7799872.1 RND family efflux transporter MFP subunit [Beijerinckia sp. GAS462]SED40590.1 RND family efflux transporter, MFP subunit [Beijerinckia sp. 28-YEA-48]
MIVVLLNVYLLLLFLLVKLRVVRFNLFWKVSPFLVLFLLLVGLFIPMGWGAPEGSVVVGRHSVSIVPDVAGEVIDVPVQPNVPIKAGDVLFKIDPTPFEAQFRAVGAQLKLAELRLAQMTELARKQATPEFNVEQRQAEVDQLKAQQESAQWNLDKTIVRAPADGFVTNVALRRGARVSNLSLSPAMAFIDTATTILVVEIPQNDARYVAEGQRVELTFKYLPGQILTGKVEAVLQAISTGQEAASGMAVTPQQIQAAPFVVRVALDDAALAATLPAGSAGKAAIFTDRVNASHVIRQVLLRQEAIMNYVLPF